EKYKELLDKYPNSEHRADYAFYYELSDLLASLSEINIQDPVQLVQRTALFITGYGANPLLTEDYKRAIGGKLAEIVMAAAKDAQQTANPDSPVLVDKFEEILFKEDLARRILLNADQRATLSHAFEDVRVAVAKVQQRDKALAELRGLAAKPSIVSIK